MMSPDIQNIVTLISCGLGRDITMPESETDAEGDPVAMTRG